MLYKSNKNTIFVITCPLFYINGLPHIGHLLSIIICDFLKKCLLLSNKNCFLLLGTDEHGSKVFKSINNDLFKQKKTYEELSEYRSNKFKNLAILFNIDFNFFTRTSYIFHKNFVLNVIDQLKNDNLLFIDNYEGFYSEREECFFEKQDEENTLIFKREKCCYFSINNSSKYILDFIKNNENILNIKEIKKIINETHSICISRPAGMHGIQFSLNNDSFTSYVWFDALQGYLSIFKKMQFDFKNIQFIHVFGKDITRFHCTLLPFICNYIGISTPTIFPHGLIINNNKKISKSFNNFKDFENLIEHNDEYLRFYLLSKNLEEDIEFNFNLFDEIKINFINNKFGNLISRVLKLLEIFDIDIFSIDKIDDNNLNYIKNVSLEFQNCLQSNLYNINQNLFSILFKYINYANNILNNSQIWLSKKDDITAYNILFICLEIIRICTTYIWPFMPIASENILYKIFNIYPLSSVKRDFVVFNKFNKQHFIPFNINKNK